MNSTQRGRDFMREPLEIVNGEVNSGKMLTN